MENIIWNEWDELANIEPNMQTALYANVRLWQDKGILLSQKYREENNIYPFTTVFDIYRTHFGEVFYNHYCVFELEKIPVLDLHEIDIKNLYFLPCCKKLKELNLSYNSLADISPLQYLQNLEILDLKNNAITAISALANCKNLKYLNIRKNQIAENDIIKLIHELPNCEIITGNYDYDYYK